MAHTNTLNALFILLGEETCPALEAIRSATRSKRRKASAG